MITYNFYNYKPVRFDATEDEKRVRELVWRFKDGNVIAQMFVANYVSKVLKNRKDAKETVFVCIPASNSVKTERRYKQFSSMICDATGLVNGYRHIHVSGHKTALHNVKRGQEREDDEVITVDKDFFQGKKVIIFDDIITKGVASNKFANILIAAGANVLGGLFLAKTIN
jgi:predicted amidophosphoribosyltransferase